jgi:hypothetical protein
MATLALFADVSLSTMYVKDKGRGQLSQNLNIYFISNCLNSTYNNVFIFKSYGDIPTLLVHEDVSLSAMFQARGCTVVEPLHFHLLAN